jgi:FkbM family methyltransferase
MPVELRRLVRRGLARAGLSVSRARWHPRHLSRHGAPNTIVDVGVATGTPELYAAYPDARLVLVEPLREYDEPVGAILAERDGVHLAIAAGAEPGEAHIHVEPRNTSMSSLLTRTGATATDDPLESRRVVVDTLDHATTGLLVPPVLLKVDVEGYELEVLRGASQVLAQAETVIVETSVLERFVDGATLLDVMTMMDQAGFDLRDVLRMTWTGEHLRYVDALFARR